MNINLPYGMSFDLLEIAAPLATFRPLMVAVIWVGVLLSSVRLLTRLLGLGVSSAEQTSRAVESVSD